MKKAVKYLLYRLGLLLMLILLLQEAEGQKGQRTYKGGRADGLSYTTNGFTVAAVQPETVCEYSPVTLKVEIVDDGTGVYQFEWRKVGKAAAIGYSALQDFQSVVLSDTGRYFCQVTNREGVTVISNTVSLSVKQTPVAAITQPDARTVSLCWGDSIPLQGSSSLQEAVFSWRGQDIGSCSEQEMKVSPRTKSDYIFRTAYQGCYSEDTVTVEVNRPTVAIPFALSAVPGQQLSVQATDAWGEELSQPEKLEWTTNLSALPASGMNPYVLTVTQGLEQVYVAYEQAGCTAYDSMRVAVKGLGAFHGGANDGFSKTNFSFGIRLELPEGVCEQVDTALRAVLQCGDNPASYRLEWFKRGQPDVSLGTAERIALTPLQMQDTGYYYCKAFNAFGDWVSSDTLYLHVNAVARADIAGVFSRDTLMCEGDTLLLEGYSSVPSAKMSWRGGSMIGNPYASFIQVSPHEETTYILRTDNEGCGSEDTVIVKVNRPFVRIPSLVNATQGSTVKLTAVDREDGELEAQGLVWTLKPSGVTKENINPYILSSVQQDTWVEVMLDNGKCTAKDSTHIRVKGNGAFRGGRQDGFSETCLPPVIVVQPVVAARQCLDENKPLELKVVAEGSHLSFCWEKWSDKEYAFLPFIPSHPGVKGEKTSLLRFTDMQDSDNGRYRCVIKGLCGETVISDACDVSVKGEPVIVSGINADRDVCAGSGSFDFNVIAVQSVGNGTLNYRWYKNRLSSPLTAYSPTGKTYHLEIGPDGTEEGLYIVEVKNDCGSVYDSAYLPVVVPPMILDQSLEVKVCEGGVADFWVKTNRDDRYRYELYELSKYPELNPMRKVAEGYSPSLSLSGVTKGGFYQMKVFHELCDSVTFSSVMALQVEHEISLTEVSPDTTLCEGETLWLKTTASALDEELPVYQWYKDGLLLADEISSHLRIPAVRYGKDTVYYHCTVTNSCGELRSRDIAVAVKRKPVIYSGPAFLPEYCEGDTVRAEVKLQTGFADRDSVRWFYKGKPLQDIPGRVKGTTTLSLEIDSVTSEYGGASYQLMIYNRCQLVRSVVSGFTLLEPARFTGALNDARLLLCEGEEYTLVTHASGTEPIRYIWTQNGKVVADGYSNRLKVDASSVNKAETFTCHIQNMCSQGGVVTTAYVTTSRPDLFDFGGGGYFCERDETGVEACLQASDSSVLYHLYRKPEEWITSTHGRNVSFPGGEICFNGLHEAGEYYVVAEDTNGCTAVMPGEAVVKMNALPTDFGLMIIRQLCENENDAEAEIPGSEKGVDYYLCQLNNQVWDTLKGNWPMAGTGRPLHFRLTAGEYKVVARNRTTGCSRDLSPVLTIVKRPLPPVGALMFTEKDSVYCRYTVSNIALEQREFEVGSVYQLLKDGHTYGEAREASPVVWTGLEEGRYRVKAVNRWGCTTTYGNKVVTAQEPPYRYGLIGQHYYCEGDSDSSWIELNSTTAGVQYSFRYSPGEVYADTMGTGQGILLKVPLTDRDYYVIARDTTAEHCESAMFDTVQLRQSRLTVVPQTPVRVAYKEETQLNITVEGAVGDIKYVWTPSALLQPGGDLLEDPLTLPLEKSGLFQVTVTDGAGCPKLADVLVTVTGGNLNGGIKNEIGEDIDTLYCCQGEGRWLMALATGGGCEGNYDYFWRNEHTVLSEGMRLNLDEVTAEGKIFLEVLCGEEYIRDTVMVFINPTPVTDTLVAPGLRCVSGEDALKIELKNSQSGTFYQLKFSEDRAEWKDVGNRKLSSGGRLVFWVTASPVEYGYFRVMAVLPHESAEGESCSRWMEGEVEVRRMPLDFGLSEGWAYCEDEFKEATIALDSSETGISYLLKRVDKGVVSSKTGTGDTLKFTGLWRGGDYVVEAVAGHCRTIMKDTVRVTGYPMPEIYASAGTYCDAGTVGGVVKLQQMEAGVLYRLETLDTLYGPGEGAFRPQPVGTYRVFAENKQTGCRSEFTLDIISTQMPQEFALEAGCYSAKEVPELLTTGSEEGVEYVLWRNGVAVPSSQLTGNGNRLNFGKPDRAGVYSVWAGTEDCGLLMKDSVIVYDTLRPFEAEVAGVYCQGQTEGVELKLKNTVPGWKYYVQQGGQISAVLQGGGTLSWKNWPVSGQVFTGGKYGFYAVNPCGRGEKIGEYEVETVPAPQLFQVMDKPLYNCVPESFRIVLNGSENGVNYIVKRYNAAGDLLQEYSPVEGTGQSGEFELGTYSLPGVYEIVAENRCSLLIDRWEVAGGNMPDRFSLKGKDICRMSDTDSLAVALGNRQNSVDYYLYRESASGVEKADSLTAAYRPAPELSFRAQKESGCYYVIAEDGTTGCSRGAEERYCLNDPPAVFRIEPSQALGDTLTLCQGEDSCIWLSGSEAGTGYELLLNGSRVQTAVGTGGRLKAGKITGSGTYRVRAYACGVMMDDSVVVKINVPPVLQVSPEIRFCQGTTDSIRVLSATSDRWIYTAWNPDGSLFYQCSGRSDGGSLLLPQSLTQTGYYPVEVKDERGCSRKDSVEVIREASPDAYDLVSETGSYICRGGQVMLGLSGSESEVTYTLYRYAPARKMAETEGNGGPFVFQTAVSEPGIYYVTAKYRTGLGCEVSYGSYELKQADTLLPLEVKSVVNEYCATASVPQGSIRLENSQVGIEYRLMRDGVVVESSLQVGDGHDLLWTALEGKVCDDMSIPDGYVYRVIAHDPQSGCERVMFGSDTIIAVTPVRVIGREPSNAEVEKCVGTEMMFNVNATGCRLMYQWMKNGAVIKKGSEPYYNISSLEATDYGEYTCRIANSCGSVTTPRVQLNVREPVELIEPMKDVYVCKDSPEDVLFAPGYRHATAYRWYKLPDGETIISRNNLYKIRAAELSDTAVYVCVADNVCAQEVRDSGSLRLGYKPEFTLSAFQSDTLCAGQYYKGPKVTAAIPFEWYLNGKKLDFTGEEYVIPSVTHAHEGNYTVVAENACGSGTLPVATLVVDDSLQVADYSGPLLIRCPSEQVELAIDIRPSGSRVAYRWEDSRQKVLGTENRLFVGPFEANSSSTYRVWFMNKCTEGNHNYRDVVVQVPDSIRVADPLRDIVLCADCATDTVLRLGLEKTMMAEFEWYYRKPGNEEVQGELVSTADTVVIRACTANTGYYYCRYFNRCETKTTETSWVRIDSVPVVQDSLTNDTICEGLPYRKVLTATGGGLHYRWKLLLKDGTVVSLPQEDREEYVSSSVLSLHRVGLEYDSCRMICYVENGCGKDTTNEMLLRVIPQLQLSFTPVDTTVCAGDTALLQLSLVAGACPWSYTYRCPDGILKEVWNVQGRTDTLKAGQAGSYEIVAVKDRQGCEILTDLPRAQVDTFSVPELIFSGSQELCRNEEAEVRLQITGGIGPWRVKIVNRHGPAEEMGGNQGLQMWGRDTLVRFTVQDSNVYIVYRVEDLGTGCQGIPQDSGVSVLVHQPGYIQLETSQLRVGQCKDVNLRELLKPALTESGLPLPGHLGHFYVNSVDKGISGWILQEELRGDACFEIRCEYKDENGCRVRSDELQVCVDSLPYAEVVSSDYSCQGQAMDFSLHFYPENTVTEVVVRQTRYKKWKPGLRPTVAIRSFSASDVVAGQLDIPLNWDNVGSPDSCIVFEVMRIEDIYGCRSAFLPEKETIWRHWDPEVEIETRKDSESEWTSGRSQVSLVKGDSVEVKVVLKKGMSPWDLPLQGMYTIRGNDTTFWLKEEGHYVFRAEDGLCGRHGVQPWPELEVVYVDTGYFRGRLFLEGPFDVDNGDRMHSSVGDSLGLPSSLPLKPSGLEVIDWIEVELRSGSPVDSVALLSDSRFVVSVDSCLLLSNGQLADRWSGDTLVGIRDACSGSGNYRYVLVKHRNHMGVMSRNPVYFISGSSVTQGIVSGKVDFSRFGDVYCRDGLLDNHMTKFGFGGQVIWLLSAGEMNLNRLISLYDPNRITLEETGTSLVSPSYDPLYDINFDGRVDWPGWNTSGTADWDMVRRNRQKFMEIK